MNKKVWIINSDGKPTEMTFSEYCRHKFRFLSKCGIHIPCYETKNECENRILKNQEERVVVNENDIGRH